MRRKLIVLLCLIGAGTAFSQDLVYAEYFIDADPGYGNAISLNVTPSPVINNLSFSVSTAGLTNGFHHFYVRVRDAQGKWSITNVRPFLKETVYTNIPDLVAAEYFTDTDPGLGYATPVNITPGHHLDSLSLILDISTLPNGFHHLFIRVRDARGKWSLANVKPFLKETVYTNLPDLVAAEYFIDTDPGFGNATPVNLTAGQIQDSVTLMLDISAIPPGFHHLYFRAKDEHGKWSHTNIKSFLREKVYSQAQKIVKAEYFFNTDPGYGNGVNVPITPDSDIDSLDIVADVSVLPLGTHNLMIRVMDENGQWSQVSIKPFDVNCALMQVRFSADTGCAAVPLLFSDSSINIFPNASYHWNFGDGTPVVIATKGDTTHIYQLPGNYTATLSIHSRAECIQQSSIPVYIQAVPPKPATPQGPTEIAFGTDSTNYWISGASQGTIYYWELIPTGAGTIQGNGPSVIVYWDSSYTGMVELRVKGSNNHCSGIFSESLLIEVSNTAYRFILEKQLCDGETSFWWRDQLYTQSGIYYDSLVTSSGHDSVYILHLVISNDNTIPATLSARVFLQGAYTPNGMMRNNLKNLVDFPMSQPYNAPPWNYPGTESLISVPDSVVDWILVELRSTPDTIVDRRAALLLRNGNIVDYQTKGPVALNRMGGKSYYVAVHHRNHLPIMTASPECLPNAFSIDFSDTAYTLPYGGVSAASVTLSTGRQGMICGDVNRNRQLKYSGSGNDRSLILQKIVQVSSSNSINTTISGYFTEDLSMDGIVKYSGSGNDASIIIQNIVTKTGTNAITGIFQSIVPIGVNAIPQKD